MHFADNANPDQLAQSLRLIRAFIGCLQYQWILKYIMSMNRKCPDQTAWMGTLMTVALNSHMKCFKVL